jgi:hypothetical protein
MEENIICIVIRNAWIPIVLISLLAAFVLIIKFKKEKDFLEKDRIESKIKYPVIILIAAVISTPLWELLASGGILPIECNASAPVFASLLKIKNFSDGSSEKNISFLMEGGVNSEIGFKIPYKAKVVKTSMGIEHPIMDVWSDEFYNMSFTEFNDGISVNYSETYAYIKMSVLEVNGTTILDGRQVFDDIYVKNGGRLLVGKSRGMDLLVRGNVKVDIGGEINADGIPEVTNPDYETSSSAGNSAASGGGGGGHGGDGGNGGDDDGLRGGEGGLKFDSEENPLLPGQNGGGGGGTTDYAGSGLTGSGGLGGGIIRINAKRIVVDGSITANGGNGVDSAESEGTAGGGGGGGGTIQLITDNLVLNGRLSANGGNGGNDRQIKSSSASDGAGGGGGGGRIEITSNKKSGDEAISVEGGKGGKSSNPAKNGGDGKLGTIHLANKEVETTSFIYANMTSVEIKPDNLKKWVKFYANSTTYPGSDIQFSILSSFDDVLCKIDKDSALLGYDITECAKGADAIKLHTDLNTVTFSRTPKIFNWKVEYESELKGLTVDIGQSAIKSYKKDIMGKVVISDDNTMPKMSEEITKTLQNCSCRGCTPLEDACVVSIAFSSNSSGLLMVGDPYIEYYE